MPVGGHAGNPFTQTAWPVETIRNKSQKCGGGDERRLFATNPPAAWPALEKRLAGRSGARSELRIERCQALHLNQALTA
jgi:hypothetical protein